MLCIVNHNVTATHRPSTTDRPSRPRNKPSVGSVAGAVIGSTAAVALLLAAVAITCIKRRKRQQLRLKLQQQPQYDGGHEAQQHHSNGTATAAEAVAATMTADRQLPPELPLDADSGGGGPKWELSGVLESQEMSADERHHELHG